MRQTHPALLALAGILLLAGCTTPLPPRDPHQAWVDMQAPTSLRIGADQLNGQPWPDRRYFQVTPGEHRLQLRTDFEATSGSLGNSDPEWRSCLLELHYTKFAAGERYLVYSRPYAHRALALLKDDQGKTLARGRVVRCGTEKLSALQMIFH